MKNVIIPVGVSSFAEIRTNGYYYIDKSGLIEQIMGTSGTKITLITRPRRFGKTLAMSMLESFYDIRKNSKILFEGLEIAKNQSLCSEWMNQFPTLFVTFKDVDGLTFESAKGMLRAQIAQLYNEHDYLLDSKSVSDNDKQAFHYLADMMNVNPDDTMLKNSLLLIMRMLQNHYGKEVILLLDEYDVPMAKASVNGYYAQMLEIIRAIMSTALKDNRYLRFAVITGCLKISKESIFTGTNNFISDTITDSRLNEYFGFTQNEVNQILADTGYKEKSELVRTWYDGYHFGRFDIYCPWDVLNYIYRLHYDPDSKPQSFWKNTSDNAIIRSFIDVMGNSISEKLEVLMAGGYIRERIVEDMTYDYLHSSEENFWSVLYLTGYLTRMRALDLTKHSGDMSREIRKEN